MLNSLSNILDSITQKHSLLIPASCFVRVVVLLVIALTIMTSPVAAQEADTVASLPGIEIETSVDLAEAYIGDLITYKVIITYDTLYELIPPPLGANLGAFDVKDYHPDVESKLDDGRNRSENTFVLSTFTTGDYIIPPVPIFFKRADESGKYLLTEPVPIKINSLLLNADDSADIRPLKEQAEFKRNWTPYFGGGGAALALLAALFLWWKLRKKKKEAEFIDLRSPWEIAFADLALLKQKPFLDDGQFKEYYIALTEILRSYFGRIYKVDVLEMTTEEFLEIFQEIELAGTLYVDCSSFFRHADLVKFARYIPERERVESDFKLVHDIIESVREDVIRKAQVATQAAKMSTQEPVAAGGRR